MRSRALLAAALLLALPLLAACGGDDADDSSTAAASASGSEGTASDESSDAEPGHDLTKPDLEAAVDAAQLEADDLGEGWTLTKTTPPSDDDDDDPNPLDDCLEGDLAERLDEAKVAESDKRAFSRKGEGPLPSELTSSSIGLDDADVFTDMHEVLRSEEFTTCLADSFEEAMGSSAASDVELGEIKQSADVVDPGEDEELESTGLSFPITVKAQGQTFELAASITVISTGQLGSSITYFGEEDELLQESVAEWGRLLAERLVGG